MGTLGDYDDEFLAAQEDAAERLDDELDEQATSYEGLAAEFDTVATGHIPNPATKWLAQTTAKWSLLAIEWWRAEGVEWSQSPGTAEWWRAQGDKVRARAAKLRNLAHPQVSFRQPTAKELAA